MEIKEIKVKNLDLLEKLVNLEHENRGMVNGRDIMIKDARIVFGFSATLPELLSIKNISSSMNFSIKKDHNKDFSPEKCEESLLTYTDNEMFAKKISEIFADDIAKENNFGFAKDLPIGAIRYNGIATFAGSAIRGITSTGSYVELFESRDDEEIDLGEILPGLFYRAVYKDMMNSMTFDYSPLNRFLNKSRYLEYTEGSPATMLNIFNMDGEVVVSFVDTDTETLSKNLGDLRSEKSDISELTGASDTYVTINCYMPIFLYYIIKLSDDITVIDEEPMPEFLKKKKFKYEDADADSYGIRSEFEKIDNSDTTNFLSMMGMIPGNTMYHFTIQIKLDLDKNTLKSYSDDDTSSNYLTVINHLYVAALSMIRE